jgi:hypothetical protein
MNRFDASAPPPDEPGPEDLLERLTRRQVGRDLDALLDRFDELEARLAEQEAEEELEPGIVQALETVTGAPDAPLTFRSLHDRVERGLLSWKQFWADPRAEADGMKVLNAATRLRMGEIAQMAQEQPPPS